MHTVLTNGHIKVRWEDGGQLILSDFRDETTRVAGGLLFELAPARRHQHPWTVGVGFPESGHNSPSETVPERFSDRYGSGVRLTRSYPVAVQPLRVDWTVWLYDEHNIVEVQVTVRNVGVGAVAVRRVFPFVSGAWWDAGSLRLEERESGFAAYKSGWQSWSYAGGLPPEVADPRVSRSSMITWHSPGGRAPRQPIGGAVDVVSEGVAMIGHAAQTTAFLAGFLSQDQWIGQVYVQRQDGAIAASVLTDDCVLAPGGALTTPPLVLALGDQRTLLPQYADAVSRWQRARQPADHQTSVPVGWCSWYYYFTDVSEAAVLENLDALSALRETVPVEVVQVDDGYQTAVGDWLSIKSTFPSGLQELAQQIRERGFRPGLWLAPFTVAANSQLAHEHPDWLIRDARGRLASSGHNWNVALYGLDTSHPGAQAWLRNLFTTVVRDWGFDYLKLDFLASAALRGQRHDLSVTRAQALRMGLQLIRDVVGDEVFLLGCGCPLLSAVGIVDAMRIGPDSAPHWKPRYRGLPLPLSEGHPLPNMEGAVRNTLARAWMSPDLWINDPDCLLLRDRKTALTTDEVRAFASAVALTGGMVLFSDRVSELTSERLQIAARLLPPLRERALPLSNFTGGIPDRVCVPIQRAWGSWLLVGIFNNDATEREHSVTWSALGLAPGAYHAVEFWSGRYQGLFETGVTVRVPAHGAAVLAITAASTDPLLLSTSFHISQGGAEVVAWSFDRDASRIHWKARLGRTAAGQFILWLPARLRPRALTSTAAAVTWRKTVDGVYVVDAEITDAAQFTLELESIT